MFSASQYSFSPYSANLKQPHTNIADSIGVVTNFGIPSMLQVPTSISPVVTFGTPVGYIFYAASTIGRNTVFGDPIADVDQIGVAESFGPTVQFGDWFYSFIGSPPANRTFIADSVGRNTIFGVPSGFEHLVCVPTSIYSTTLGAPTTKTNHLSDSLGQVTVLGVPGSTQGASVSSINSTVIETPNLVYAVFASSIPPSTAFGQPSAVRSNAYIPYSIQPTTRFGQPKLVADVYLGSSINSTQFGTPDAVLKYRPLSIPPVAIFGTPTALRTPLC